MSFLFATFQNNYDFSFCKHAVIVLDPVYKVLDSCECDMLSYHIGLLLTFKSLHFDRASQVVWPINLTLSRYHTQQGK